mgnify:CR=1 FL=1
MSIIDLNIHRVVPQAMVSSNPNCAVLHLHVRTREYDAVESWEIDDAMRLALFFQDDKLREGITNLINALNDELVRLYKLEAEESE